MVANCCEHFSNVSRRPLYRLPKPEPFALHSQKRIVDLTHDFSSLKSIIIKLELQQMVKPNKFRAGVHRII